jgi:hypothetical protein
MYNTAAARISALVCRKSTAYKDQSSEKGPNNEVQQRALSDQRECRLKEYK